MRSILSTLFGHPPLNGFVVRSSKSSNSRNSLHVIAPKVCASRALLRLGVLEAFIISRDSAAKAAFVSRYTRVAMRAIPQITPATDFHRVGNSLVATVRAPVERSGRYPCGSCAPLCFPFRPVELLSSCHPRRCFKSSHWLGTSDGETGCIPLA